MYDWIRSKHSHNKFHFKHENLCRNHKGPFTAYTCEKSHHSTSIPLHKTKNVSFGDFVLAFPIKFEFAYEPEESYSWIGSKKPFSHCMEKNVKSTSGVRGLPIGSVQVYESLHLILYGIVHTLDQIIILNYKPIHFNSVLYAYELNPFCRHYIMIFHSV